MTKTQCIKCRKVLWRSPSKIEPRNFCSRECYAFVRNKELVKNGKEFRITPKMAKKFEKKRIKAIKEKTKGSKHYAWKGEKVSYRGLHTWLEREKGKARNYKCACGKQASDWANIDGQYGRVLDDYIPMCKSCHKLYDRAMKSTRDGTFENQ